MTIPMRQVAPILPVILLKLRKFYSSEEPSLGLSAVGEEDASRKPAALALDVPNAGVDRLLLFSGIAPVAAVPSRAVHVLVRLLRGDQNSDIKADYETAQQALDSHVPRQFAARQSAYSLLERHAELTCKHDQPRCKDCPVNLNCVYFSERVKTGKLRDNERQ